MKKIKFIFAFVIYVPFITACSSLNSNFECPMKPGVRCESLDQVNAQVDRGEIGSHSISKITYQGSTNVTTQPISLYNNESVNNLSAREPLRYGETVKRVWIAPYEDTAGNYHQESDVYTITKPGHWIGYPPKESNGDEG